MPEQKQKAVPPEHHATEFLANESMIAFAGLSAIFAAWRCHAVNPRIERGGSGPDRGLIVFVTALIVSLTIVFIYALESGGKL